MNETPRDENHDMTEPNSAAHLSEHLRTTNMGAEPSASQSDAFDAHLLSALTQATPSVPALTDSARAELWAQVQRGIAAHALNAEASAVVTAESAQPASATITRRFFPSGALGRSVFALAACSAAFAVGVAVWPSQSATQVDASARSEVLTAPLQQTPAEPDLAQATEVKSAGDSADAGSVVLPQEDTKSQRKMASCVGSATPNDYCADTRVPYGVETTSSPAGNPDAPIMASAVAAKVTLVASPPKLQSEADGLAAWAVHLTFTNVGEAAVTLAGDPDVEITAADPADADQTCTVQSRTWHIGDHSYTSAPTLQPDSPAVLTVTSVCAQRTDARPETRVTWQVLHGARDAIVFSERMY